MTMQILAIQQGNAGAGFAQRLGDHAAMPAAGRAQHRAHFRALREGKHGLANHAHDIGIHGAGWGGAKQRQQRKERPSIPHEYWLRGPARSWRRGLR